MIAAARRARVVRLRAGSEALVRRGAILLEDALRTASLPSVRPGRVLVIRSLDVGVIRSDRPPASVALQIERRVREITASAIHGEDPAAERRSAVYFRDDVEPLIALAARIARQEPVTAWFWPLVVPGSQPDLPREEVLRLCLKGALRTSAGPAAAVRLVEALAMRRCLEPLLRALRPEDGPALLAASGWALPSEERGVVRAGHRIEEREGIALGAALSQWVPMWGERDARSVWLAATVLVVDRRGRLLDRLLTERAERLLELLVRPHSSAAVSPSERARASAKGPILATAIASDGGPRGRIEPLGSRPEGALSARTPDVVPAGAPQDRRADTVPARRHDPWRERGSPAVRSAPVDGLQRDGNGESTIVPDMGVIGAAPEPSSPEPSSGTPARAFAPPAPVGPHPMSSVVLENGDLSTGDAAPVCRVEDVGASPPPWQDIPRPTVVGGLFYLVPVLDHLGIAAQLDARPHLLEREVPERLLCHVAERLGAPAGDPMLAVLGGPYSPDGAHPGREELELLLRGLVVDARRWCRRNARIGLRDLVCRPGRVTATRTHVDVIFDVEQIDLRVRLAGLDVDPGWVAWLGRVVRYHYLRGEHGHG